MTRSMDLQRAQAAVAKANREAQGWLPEVSVRQHTRYCEVAYHNPNSDPRQEVWIKVEVVGPEGQRCHKNSGDVCLYKVSLMDAVMDISDDYTQKVLARAQKMAAVIAKALNEAGIKPATYGDYNEDSVL